MATTTAQSRTPESERNIVRRPETQPSREHFNFGALPSFGPFSMMRRLSEEMDRAFASTFGLSRETAGAGWSPVIEVREKDGDLEVAAELPGLKKEDIKVECIGGGLIIEGERRQQHAETQGGVHRSERSYGHFYRMIPLPEGADTEKAQAEFKDGLLQVHVPIPESRPRGHQIPITS